MSTFWVSRRYPGHGRTVTLPGRGTRGPACAARRALRAPPFQVTLKGKAQPGKRDEVQRLFEQHLAPRAVGNAAQEIVVWCADNVEPETFYPYEVYGDATAMQENARAPWFGQYMAAVGPLLAGQPEVVTATPMWMKPATA